MKKRGLAGMIVNGLISICLYTGCGRVDDGVRKQGERVVSLAPSLTEIVYAVGGGNLMVGRTSYCNYPPEAASVTAVGGFGMPSFEKLVALQPTLVLEVDLAESAIAQKIDRLGLRRKRIKCSTLDDVPQAIREVAGLINCSEKGGKLARQISDEILRLRSEAASITNRPKVFVEIWGDPPQTVGKNSFVSDLVNLAGGANIGDEAANPYYQVSSEWVVSRNPDIILCLYMSSAKPVRDAVMNRSGWDGVSAVRAKRVYDGFNNDVMLRPGPRVLEGFEQLRKCIRPEKEAEKGSKDAADGRR